MDIINKSSMPEQYVAYLEKFKSKLLDGNQNVAPSKLQILYGKKENVPKLTDEQLMLMLLANYSALVEVGGHQFYLDDGITSLFNQIVQWILHYPNRGLLLCGNKLSGKKTICECLCRHFKAFYGWPFYVQMISANDFHDLFKSRDKDECIDMYKSIVNARVLFVTDLGEEPERCIVYGESQKPVYNLLSIRHRKSLVTIITTNLKPNDFLKRYDQSIVGLLSLEFASFSTNNTEYVKMPKQLVGARTVAQISSTSKK